MVNRKIVQIDEEKCDGCGQCIPNCAEGALKIIEGKARLVDDAYCDGLGACLGHCPRDAITIVEREAHRFDEDAVHRYLEETKTQETLACGCPSTLAKALDAQKPEAVEAPESALRNWPVQLNLVPVQAPFFEDADLLVMADCTSVTYPGLHQKLLKGRTVVIGCPKFDDAGHYVEKLAEILRRNDVRSLTVAHMEVPCCGALDVVARRALEASGKMIPSQRLIVTVEGGVRRA